MRFERSCIGYVVDADTLHDWKYASPAASVFLASRQIRKLADWESKDKVSALIVNALRRIEEQTCTICQAQHMIRLLVACWDMLSYGPELWMSGCVNPGIDLFNMKKLMSVCEQIVSENRTAYLKDKEFKASDEDKPVCTSDSTERASQANGRTVRVSIKKKEAKVENELSLKKFKVPVQRTAYGELIIPASCEAEAVAIASGQRRMYDGSWASEHFIPQSHDTYLEVWDAGAVEEVD